MLKSERPRHGFAGFLVPGNETIMAITRTTAAFSTRMMGMCMCWYARERPPGFAHVM